MEEWLVECHACQRVRAVYIMSMTTYTNELYTKEKHPARLPSHSKR